MRKVELYINNLLVDMDYNEGVAVYTLAISDVNNPSTIKNDFATSINLPKTQTNNKVFEHMFRVDRVVTDTFNPSKKVDYQLFINGKLYREGYVKVNKITQDGYDVSLYGKLGEFFAELDDIKLRDLIFEGNNPTLEHDINAKFIQDNYYYNTLQHEQWTDMDDTTWGTDIHNIIRYIPSYQGLYKDFASDKVDDGVYVNDNGERELKKLDYKHDEFMQKEFRSYKQKPSIRVSSMIYAIKKTLKSKNSKYTFDSELFNDNNPYYADSVFMLKSFQDSEKDGAKSIAGVKTNASSTTTGMGRMYMDLIAKDSNDQIIKNGKYDFSNFVNANMNLDTKVKCKIEFNFSGDENYNHYVFYAPTYPQYQYFIRPSINSNQAIIKESGYGLELLKELSQNGDYLIARDKVVNGAYLYRVLTPEEAKYCFSDEWNNGDYSKPMENPNYDGRYGNLLWWGWQPCGNLIELTNTQQFIVDKATTTDAGSVYVELGTIQQSTFSPTSWVLNNLPYGDKLADITLTSVKLQYVDTKSTASLIGNTVIATNTKISTKNLFTSDMTAKSFLLEYTKLFDGHYDLDIITNKIDIKTRESYYKDKEIMYLDDYLAEDKEHTLTPIIFENKFLKFNYKDGNNSEYTKQYKERYDEIYGQQLVDTGYDFNSDKKDVYNNTLFYPIAMSEQTINTSQLLTLPCMFEYSEKDRKAVSVSDALLFITRRTDNIGNYRITDDTKFMQREGDVCWNNSADTTTNIPLLGGLIPLYSTFNGAKGCSWDIARPKSLWSGQTEAQYPTSYCIFPKFHENYIRDKYSVNTKKFSGYFRLKYLDLLRFKFSKFVYLKGRLWTVDNIKIDLLSEDLTKIELISVEDINNYTVNTNSTVPYLLFLDNMTVEYDTTRVNLALASNISYQMLDDGGTEVDVMTPENIVVNLPTNNTDNDIIYTIEIGNPSHRIFSKCTITHKCKFKPKFNII